MLEGLYKAEFETPRGGADFGDEFLPGISIIAEAFAQIAVTAMFRRGPVHQLM
jgi:hypothetical protein